MSMELSAFPRGAVVGVSCPPRAPAHLPSRLPGTVRAAQENAEPPALPAQGAAGPPQGNRASRRLALLGVPSAALAAALLPPEPAQAFPSFTAPPPGFRLYVDRFDGYSFYIPETWIQVRGSGQDCFFRSPSALDENISVQVSSPSSSRFMDISDLGSPEEAGQQLLKQFLTEFMSTRLGVKREPKLLRTNVRTTMDGDDYYEIELNVKSFANNNQMAILPEERIQVLEWDRHYLTLLGVSNNRLYQMRAQVPERLLDAEFPQLRQILNSFQAFEILAV